MPGRRRPNDKDNALRKVRESRGLTQATASQRLGVSRTMWSSWECKQRHLTVAQLNKMQRVLTLADEEVEQVRKWWGEPAAEESKAA